MSRYVFLGPTLPLAEAKGLLDAVYLPPVRQGDLLRLVREQRPSVVGIVDAVTLDDLGSPEDSPSAPPCLALVKADAWSYAVACASIVAKAERDRMLVELDREYPLYGFARHKGYGAPDHLAALAKYGPSPLHRLTFRSVLPRRDERAA